MNAKRQLRIRLVLAGVVLVCGVSLMALVYLMLNKPVEEIKPGIVVTHPSSPVASPLHMQSVPMSPSRYVFRHTWASSGKSGATVSGSASQGVSYAPLYTTSSAHVHSVGGGGNGGGVMTTTSHAAQGASGRGITYASGAASMPFTSFASIASARMMASPEAEQAPQMARLASSRHNAPGPPDLGGGELPGDHQLVEHPIGSPVVLLVAALIYVAALAFRKRKA